MLFWDFQYLIFVAPALILADWAQARVRSAYGKAQQVAAPLTGAAAARHILDQAGLQHVRIELVQGHLSDHYDPRDKVLRLSPDVYQTRSLASVGIAAHEAGHAIQDATNYAPLVVRNAAVPLAGFGSNFAFILFFIGIVLSSGGALIGQWLVMGAIGLFGAVVVFQVVNLPDEYNASSRAKAELAELSIVSPQEMVYVDKVLDAAALTYVAVTLQAILTLLYFIVRANQNRD